MMKVIAGYRGVLFGLLMILLASLACVTEAAVAPAPVVQPLPAAIELPAISAPAEVALPLTMPLPGTHENVRTRPHAVERHGEDADAVRRGSLDPRNECQYYSCTASRSANNLLRLCYFADDPEHAGVQWIYYDVELNEWVEGTSFLKRTKDIPRFLRRKGCLLVD